MNIIYDLRDFSSVNPVVTIGTFDGIHLGHQKVLSELRNEAKQCNGKSVVFTFLQHPRAVLFPEDTSLKLLTSFQEKAVLIEKAGIDYLIAYPFTLEFSQIRSEDFIKEFLVEKIKLHTLVIGYDHQFGKNREGSSMKHEELAEFYGYKFKMIDAHQTNNENVSSTKIRNYLLQGDVKTANTYLGRSYELSGIVVEGQKLGRQIGYPTANISVHEKLKLIPANGVYAVQVEYDQKYFNGMLNIGNRPTVSDGQHVSIEVNIFNFDMDIYNKSIKVFFFERLRNEQKFDSVEKLKQQLHSDQIHAQALLSGL